MSPAAAPPLSVLLVTDGIDTIRETLAHFRRQEGVEELELVVVAPHGAVDREAPELAGFGAVQLVEVDSVAEPPLARAKAVHAAKAPLVLFAETHAFPRPGYVRALVRAHQAGPWVAVGPAMANANPDSLLSWANILLDYGPWLDPDHAGVADDVPGHNAAYKRAALLAFGDELPERLRADSLMHAELRRRGGELYLEPDARVDHQNVSTLRWSLVERFHSSRNFAAHRRRGWPRGRRVLYVAGAPLIPLVRLRRILGHVRRSPGARARMPRLLPVLVFCLYVSAAGELAGYLAGGGRTRLLYDIELHRTRYMRRADRNRLA